MLALSFANDDSSFSVLGSNVQHVADFGSTTPMAFVRYYAENNSNTGYIMGVSNVFETTPIFTIGELSGTKLEPVSAVSISIFDGKVGIGGILEPVDTLEVAGNATVNGQLTLHGSNAPFILESSLVVTNLNADMLDGQDGLYFRNANNLNAGTIAVGRGGTGCNALDVGSFLIGNGTSPILQPTNLTWDNSLSALTINGALESTNLSTSNLTIWNSLNIPLTSTTLRTRVQVQSVRESFAVASPSQTDFTISCPGIFGGHESNVNVFVGNTHQTWISPSVYDFNLTVSYAATNTEYLISLSVPAAYGDIVDICVWPQIIQESSEEQGIVYQVVNVTSTGTEQSISTSSRVQFGGLGVGVSASTGTGEIRATGSITAHYSDKRLKTNIEEITNAVEKLENIRGVYYTQNDFAEQFGYSNYERQVGVIAQDIKEVLPEAVKIAPFDMAPDGSSLSGNNFLTVQYEKLVPLLIQALREQNDRINELEKWRALTLAR